MIERIKFHLDESVSNAIALGLRRREINVTTTSEAGLIGVSDREQIASTPERSRDSTICVGAFIQRNHITTCIFIYQKSHLGMKTL
ncbi:hypothetical protein PN471_10460 [Aphanizomenon sp. CS-733/32]|uniref:hypothetical protein n=1 Tax=Aphanizomenon sp. CS-733/32 TaxID=3021715 RepID=UPI00232FE0F7|nr:hypothetical protein [Aphanizomenon sp. CS-733/32]MDB9309053.1 hypothetical protein [Aphanizomenon sp. CS-733/32]